MRPKARINQSMLWLRDIPSGVGGFGLISRLVATEPVERVDVGERLLRRHGENVPGFSAPES
jgi:hypothetical protein